MEKKIKIGVFSFTCDEGCTMTLLEILNEKFFSWKDFIEFKHFRLLQSKSEIKDLDVAFVEGALSTKEDVKRIKKIRKESEMLVLLGNCAISGSPSNFRNYFDEKRKKEIEPILKRFGHMPKSLSVKEVVSAEEEVCGCPIEEKKFVEVMEKILKRFGVRHAP